MKVKIIYYITLGVVITSLMEMMDDTLYVGIYLYPSRLFLFGAYLIFAIAVIFRGKLYSFELSCRPAYRYFILTSALFLISSLFSHDIIISLKKIMYIIPLFLLPCIIYYIFKVFNITEERHYFLLFSFFVYCAVINSIFAIFQQFSGALLTDHETRQFLGISFIRVNSLFPDPNFLGLYLVIGFLLNNKYLITNKKVRYLFRFLILSAIVMTGSQGTMLSLLAGIILINLRWILFANRFKYLCLLAFPFFSMILSYYYSSFMLMNAEKSGFDTGMSRLYSWYAGLNLFADNWLFGIGPGLITVFDKADLYLYDVLPSYKLAAYNNLAAHSNYVEIAAESGVFTVLSYTLTMVFVVKGIDSKAYKNRLAPYLSSCVVASMIALSLLSYLPYFLFLFISISICYISLNRDVH